MPVSRKPISVRINFEVWLTVSAVVISVCALLVSGMRTRDPHAREQ